MYTKIHKFWKSLDRNIIVNKRELFLGMTSCTLAGVLLGILLSPKRCLSIGSYNNNTAPAKEVPAKPSPETSTPSKEGVNGHAGCFDKSKIRLRHN